MSVQAPLGLRDPPRRGTIVHEFIDGRPDPRCFDSFSVVLCPHHDDFGSAKVKPQVCGNLDCACSYEANVHKRARRLWDGTAKSPLGIRHLGDLPLGVFTLTLAPENAELLTGEKIRELWRASCSLIARELREHVGDPMAQFWIRSHLHPEGDREPGQWRPHFNFLVPLVYLAADGEVRRISAWLPLRDGTDFGEKFRARWHDAQREVLGPIPERTENIWYEWRREPEKKQHALEYFARPFPGWHHVSGVNLRPLAFGLANSKNAELWSWVLVAVAQQFNQQPLPRWGTCPKCVEEGGPAPLVLGQGATEEEARAGLAEWLAVHRRTCLRCGGHPGSTQLEARYPEDRPIVRLSQLDLALAPAGSGASRVAGQ